MMEVAEPQATYGFLKKYKKNRREEMTYKDHELNGFKACARNNCALAVQEFDMAIDLAEDQRIIEALRIMRTRCAEKAFPNKWRKFWTKIGVIGE